jgi:hypothetical protein
MSAQPPYPYPDPSAGALPGNPALRAAPPELARRGVLPFTLVHVALSTLIFLAPLTLLSAGGSNPSPMLVWSLFREGGWGMWLITLGLMFLVLISAVLGALMIRGKRVPGAALFILALGPFSAALLGTLASLRMITGAISGISVDPSQKARILAQGLSEMSNLTVYGGLGAAFAMYLAGHAAGLTLIAIDPAPLGPTPPSKAWIAGPIVGGIAAIASLAVRIALHQPIGGLGALAIFGLLNVGVLAAFAGRSLPALFASGNDEESSRAWRLLLVAAFAFAAAMLFLDRAETAAMIRNPLGAISGQSVDPSQRAAILGELGAELHGRSIVMIVDAFGCFAIFAASLLTGLAVTRKFSLSVAFAGVAALLIFGAAALTGSRTEGAVSSQRDGLIALEKAIVARGITLPIQRATGGASAFSGAPGVSIQRDGTVVDDRTGGGEQEELDPDATITVAADAALPFELFASKLVPAALKGSSPHRLDLVVAPARRYDYSALGPYAGLVGSDLQAIEAGFDDKIGDGIPAAPAHRSSWDYGGRARESGTGALGVLVDADKARLYTFSAKAPNAGTLLAETLPIEDTAAGDTARAAILAEVARSHPGLGTMVIAPGPTETMGPITNLISSIVAGVEAARLDLVITSDRAGLEALPAGAARGPAGVRLRDVTALGSLPSEVVSRILRQNMVPYVFCRDDAAAQDKAPPPAEVTLRFVIDRRGFPGKSTVSAPASPRLSACLDKATRHLSFPVPENGIVTVTARLTLR